MDRFLTKRLKRYRRWIKTGRIKNSSQVVPLHISLPNEQWILPTSQALEKLANAETIALAQCECRSHYQRCDAPLEVCLYFDKAARKAIQNRSARKISADEAVGVLRHAHNHGLVHLALFRPNFEFYALCSCCICCCHDLQLLMKFGQKGLIAHSDYEAQTDTEKCTLCGNCVAACPFQVRSLISGEPAAKTTGCFGCGLCISACKSAAISLVQKAPPSKHRGDGEYSSRFQKLNSE
jgi:ferredoxin